MVQRLHFNIPVPTTTGSASADSDATSGRLDVIFDSAFVREGMTVDGNNNTTVRINAPTTITEKLTVTSTNGAEFHSIDLTGGLSPARTITYSSETPTGSGTVGDIVYTSDPSFGQYIGWVFTPQGWKRFGLISTERDLDTWVLGDENNNGRLGIGTTSADRVGLEPGVTGGLDVRGQVVADRLLMTGISTFLGRTEFANVEIGRLAITGSLDVTGVTTFSKQVIVGAGITANQLMVTGISTFTGAGTPVIMQYKADKTFASNNVSHATTPAYITINNHGYFTGEKVQYVAGSSTIGGLTDRRTYFIIRRNSNSVKLATTLANAVSDTSINLSSAGAGTHKFILRSKSNDSAAAVSNDGVGLSVDQLHVVGIATFPAAISLTNVNLSQISVSGLSTFNGAIDVNATSEFAQPVNINATLNSNGDVNLGNANTDSITATGRFDSHLLPITDDTYNLGSSSRQWNDLYIDGVAYIDDLRADTIRITDLTDNRVVLAGANGELEDSGNLTFNGSTLALTGSQTISSNLTVTNNLTTENDVTFEGSDGSHGLHWDKSDNNLEFGDNHDIIMGDDSDLRIWHSGSHSYIRRQTGKVGDLFIEAYDGADIRIRNGNGSTGLHDAVECYANNYVALNFKGQQKLRTNSTGIQIYSGDGSGSGSITAGAVGADSLVVGTAKISDLTDNRVVIAGSSGELEDSSNLTFNGSTLALTGSQTISSNLTVTNNLITQNDVTFQESNGTQGMHWDKSDNSLTLHSNVKLKLGDLSAGDTQLYSTGSNFYLDNNDGHIYIRNNVDNDDNSDIFIQAKSGEDSIRCYDVSGNTDNRVVLFHNNQGKLRTYADGIKVYSGNIATLGTVDAATFTGDAASDNKLKNERSFSISGDITASGVSFNGTSNVNLSASIDNNTIGIDELNYSGSTGSNKFLTYDGSNLKFEEVTVAINSLAADGANRVITSDGDGTATAEGNLTFNGSTLGVDGTCAVDGVITCTGNITAFTSDIRLKTEIQPIENAVAKLLKLNGFTYEHNELAESLGYERNGERFSGVSAQDVKEVLPEAVKPAPANADYMTVQYEKLVPLLIEAIKELKAEIDELKK